MIRTTHRGDTRQAAHEVLRRCAATGETQRAFAARAGIEPATLTRLVHGMRPTESTLCALVHAWTDDEDGIAVLCAHLRDEIARAQVAEAAVSVRPATGHTEDLNLASALAEIRRHAGTADAVRQLVIDLAQVLRAASHAEARIAAEGGAEYRTRRQERKP